MRFHIGFSFRLKSLKKFIFPFLLGLLSYFGFSYFNLLSVYAYGNLDSYYNLEVEEKDFNNDSFGDYTYQELLNIGLEDYENYYVNTLITNYNNFSIITFAVYSKNATNPLVSIYNNKGSSSGSSNSLMSYDYSYQSYYSYNISSNQSSDDINNLINSLYDCLNNNICSNISSLYNLPTYYYSSNINNTDSYSFNVWTNGYYYNNQLPVINRQQNVSDNWFYVKSIKVNDNIVNFGDYIPSYCDLYSCGGGSSSDSNLISVNRLDDFFISKIDKSNLNNINAKWTFNFSDLAYVESLRWQYFFYGRINNSTYYSYESIDCTPSWQTNGYDIDLNKMSYKYGIESISCNSDLSKYDYLYVRFRLSEYNSNSVNLINNLKLTTSNGFINTSPIFNGNNHYRIMDYFDNLSSDFNILLSTTSELNYLTFKSDNDNVLMSKVDRNNNRISNLASSQELYYGTNDMTNAIIYNFSPNYSGTTDLYFFFNENNIVSLGDDSTFSYYDTNNNLVNGNINNTYQIDINKYDLSYYFGIVNNTLNDFNNDLIDLHNLFEDIYNEIPIFYQSIILLLLILSLTYILFKVVRS